MLTYYVLVECPKCDVEIHYGPCASTLEHRGLPVVTGDVMAQTRLDCPECGATVWCDDIEFYCEEDDDESEQDGES